MMIKKLSKHGNSLALVIDKPILELLGIDEHTELCFHTNGRGFTVEPADASPKHMDEGLDEVMQRIEDRYEQVFRRLAE